MYQLVDKLVSISAAQVGVGGYRSIEFVSGDTALATVCLVDKYGEVITAHILYVVNDIREFLNSGDDYALAVLYGLAKLCRCVGMRDYLVGVGESLDVKRKLSVEYFAVNNYDNSVEQRSVESLGSLDIQRPRHSLDELKGEPRYGVGFTRTCRVLNEIAFANTLGFDIFHKFVHHVELVEAWEDEQFGVFEYVRHFLAGLGFTVVKEREVRDYFGNHVLAQYALPKV